MRRALVALIALLPALAVAHPLAPALLELRSTGQAWEVLWRTPVAQARGAQVAPQLPPGCRPDRLPTELHQAEFLEQRWLARCELAGRTLSVSGLEQSGINVVVRVEQDGEAVASAILDAAQPRFVVPEQGTRGQRVTQFLGLGVEHLLTGLDHVLFVLGLLVLIRGLRPLVLAVTAFTVGHSLTLALATLGIVRVDPALTELGIALSLVAVALAILRPAASPSLLQRHPGALTLAFGLLHGLGFAGALSGVGLPAREIPFALLAFNLGIEAGQLIVIAAALALGRVLRPGWIARPALTVVVPAYIIGSLAACWCIERTLALVG